MEWTQSGAYYDLAMNRQPNKIVTTYTSPSLKVTTPKTVTRNNTVVIDIEDITNLVTSMPESLSDALEPCSKRNKKSNILSHKHAMKQSKKKAFNNGSHKSIIPKIKVITQSRTQIKDKTSEPINEESSKTLPQLKDETGSKNRPTKIQRISRGNVNITSRLKNQLFSKDFPYYMDHDNTTYEVNNSDGSNKVTMVVKEKKLNSSLSKEVQN